MLMGYLKILNSEDKILDCRAYYSNKSVMIRIKEWQEQYADLPGAYILVQPEAYKKRDHEEKKHLLKRIAIEFKKPFERPPAVYDNSYKSLYPE